MPLQRYSVGGRSAGVGNDTWFGYLWNPHASKSLFVVGISLFAMSTTSLANVTLARVTARGTNMLTITPDIDNHFRRKFAPISGALLDLNDGSASAPTIDGSRLRRILAGNSTGLGAGFEWNIEDRPIVVPHGTGLGIVPHSSVPLAGSDITFTWDE